jgi:hypothetical protein
MNLVPRSDLATISAVADERINESLAFGSSMLRSLSRSSPHAHLPKVGESFQTWFVVRDDLEVMLVVLLAGSVRQCTERGLYARKQ